MFSPGERLAAIVAVIVAVALVGGGLDLVQHRPRQPVERLQGRYCRNGLPDQRC